MWLQTNKSCTQSHKDQWHVFRCNCLKDLSIQTVWKLKPHAKKHKNPYISSHTAVNFYALFTHRSIKFHTLFTHRSAKFHTLSHTEASKFHTEASKFHTLFTKTTMCRDLVLTATNRARSWLAQFSTFTMGCWDDTRQTRKPRWNAGLGSQCEKFWPNEICTHVYRWFGWQINCRWMNQPCRLMINHYCNVQSTV